MTNPKKPAQDKRDRAMVDVDIEQFSASGHVIISAGDASIHVSTGGDVDQTNEMTITVGGVEASPAAYETMLTRIQELKDSILTSDLPPEDAEVAEHYADLVETQLTSEKKSNSTLLASAAKRLYKLSPTLATAVAALFFDPLVGQIVGLAGGAAAQLMNALKSVAGSSE